MQKRKEKSSSKLKSVNEFLGDNPRRVYKAIPKKIWMNDVGEVNGNYVDKRIEFSVSELKNPDQTGIKK